MFSVSFLISFLMMSLFSCCDPAFLGGTWWTWFLFSVLSSVPTLFYDLSVSTFFVHPLPSCSQFLAGACELGWPETPLNQWAGKRPHKPGSEQPAHPRNLALHCMVGAFSPQPSLILCSMCTEVLGWIGTCAHLGLPTPLKHWYPKWISTYYQLPGFAPASSL